MSDKIKLGPCKVVFKKGADEVTIDRTKGGVVLTYEETTREITIDQTGDTPVDELITKRAANVDVPMVGNDLDKLKTFIPGAEMVVDKDDPTKRRVDVYANKIISLMDYADVVKIVPLAESATEEDTVILRKAAPRVQLNNTYSYENELVTNVSFKGYPGEDGRLISFGDDSVVKDTVPTV
ncbi:hypothetical protein [Paenibacillus sp. OAE614]|uniref:hypothetical protein n=1 Tax=Paenibacillus sp. OAE614 TaxID=2663804 RepID=UPI00178B4DA1